MAPLWRVWIVLLLGIFHCYGKQCSNCNFEECKANGYCTYGCKNEEYWGDTCVHLCSSTCIFTCERNGDCSSILGVKCKLHYTGKRCEKRLCPTCKEQSCDHKTGLCRKGCIDGYYGANCEKSCGRGCVNNKCYQSTGICKEGCLPNFKENKCDSCLSPHHGLDCSERYCSANCCMYTCNSQGYCDKGCVDGYFGDYCDKTCSSFCRISCDRETGDCIAGCLNGYYGNQCQLPCNANCKNLSCNKNNGSCDNGCVDLKFGEACQDDCSFGCNFTCDRHKGNCTCKEGWQGDNCTKCRPDFYGSDCSKKCSSNCLGGNCHAENGTCFAGCKRGYQGHQCMLDFPIMKRNTRRL